MGEVVDFSYLSIPKSYLLIVLGEVGSQTQENILLKALGKFDSKYACSQF